MERRRQLYAGDDDTLLRGKSSVVKAESKRDQKLGVSLYDKSKGVSEETW